MTFVFETTILPDWIDSTDTCATVISGAQSQRPADEEDMVREVRDLAIEEIGDAHRVSV